MQYVVMHQLILGSYTISHFLLQPSKVRQADFKVWTNFFLSFFQCLLLVVSRIKKFLYVIIYVQFLRSV